jgi:hypothetical protein
LALNVPKCVLIPLWPTDNEQLSKDIGTHFEYWGNVAVRGHGKYLGFEIGPEAGDLSWQQPLKKFSKAAKFWGNAGLGFHFGAAAYGTYVLPILGYVAQLCTPPPEAYEAEDAALRNILPGPYRWILKGDLFQAGESYGQKRSFPSLASLAAAAQKRADQFENRLFGGLRTGDKKKELQGWFENGEHGNRLGQWPNWFNKGPVCTLFDNAARLDDMGFTTDIILKQSHGTPDPEESAEQRSKRIRKNFQRNVRKLIDKSVRQHPQPRMRHKLDRWKLSGQPGTTANRCLRALQLLQQAGSPKVAAAVLRTMWNGWTTARRFQKSGLCVFQCGGFCQEDSIEHYAHCPVGRRAAVRFLGIRFHNQGCHYGELIALGLHATTLSDKDIIKRAIWVFSLYKAFCSLSHRPGLDQDEAYDSIVQYMREATISSPKLTAVIEGREFGELSGPHDDQSEDEDDDLIR